MVSMKGTEEGQGKKVGLNGGLSRMDTRTRSNKFDFGGYMDVGL